MHVHMLLAILVVLGGTLVPLAQGMLGVPEDIFLLLQLVFLRLHRLLDEDMGNQVFDLLLRHEVHRLVSILCMLFLIPLIHPYFRV